MSYITLPFSWLLNSLYDLTLSYGLALIIFSLIIKLILLPFMMKSKYSTLRQTRLNPRVKELEKKYQGNQQKYQQEVQKLYKEEGINPMSGCLWTLIPFPIIIVLYSVIRLPLTRLMHMTAEQVELVRDTLSSLGFYEIPEKTSAYIEITYANIIHNNFDAVRAALPELADKLKNIDFSFLKMNLGDTPDYLFFTKCDWSDVSSWLPAFGLFLIPIVSAAIAFVQTRITSTASPAVNQQAGQSAKMMMMMSPIISLFIGFGFPAALGLYWAAGGLFGVLQDLWLNARYKKILDKEDEERAERDRLREAELERKRLETERLRAEGGASVNPNTSKRKLQAAERAREESRIAAEKAARRAASGSSAEKPSSQVGDRPFARGRAFVADRFEETDVAPAGQMPGEEGEPPAGEICETSPAIAETDGTGSIAPDGENEESADEIPGEAEPQTGFDTPVYTSPEYALPDEDGDGGDDEGEEE